MQFFRKSATLPSPTNALPGRPDSMPIPERHFVNGASLAGPWPDGTKTAIFAMGCFWGDEKDFWQTPGVVSTAVGYAGGFTPNPTYDEVCSGDTGHAESVLVAYDPSKVSYERAPARSSGSTTTRRRACARATTRDAVSVGHLRDRR